MPSLKCSTSGDICLWNQTLDLLLTTMWVPITCRLTTSVMREPAVAVYGNQTLKMLINAYFCLSQSIYNLVAWEKTNFSWSWLLEIFPLCHVWLTISNSQRTVTFLAAKISTDSQSLFTPRRCACVRQRRAVLFCTGQETDAGKQTGSFFKALNVYPFGLGGKMPSDPNTQWKYYRCLPLNSKKKDQVKIQEIQEISEPIPNFQGLWSQYTKLHWIWKAPWKGTIFQVVNSHLFLFKFYPTPDLRASSESPATDCISCLMWTATGCGSSVHASLSPSSQSIPEKGVFSLLHQLQNNAIIPVRWAEWSRILRWFLNLKAQRLSGNGACDHNFESWIGLYFFFENLCH